jgi:2-polyprenyl-3-methyl-5-hydroxy-6-metoxy-1,4-benzoquinol methylase
MFKANKNRNVCPLCEGERVSRIFPIDQDYAARMSGEELEDVDIDVAQCLVCGHQFVAPVPSEDFLVAFYASYMSAAKSGFYEQRYSRTIPDSFRNYYGKWLDKVISFRQGNPGDLLDIGSGLGMFLRLAQEKGFHVVGIETNAEAAKYLAREYQIEVSNSLLENYSRTKQFDVVSMWDLLEHLADPRGAITKVKLLLKPGGILVLEIPARDSLLHWVAKLSYTLSIGLVKRPLYLTYGVHYLQYFSEPSILAFLSENGFETLASYRSETDVGAIKRKPSASLTSRIKVGLYNSVIAVLLKIARVMGRQNKVVLFARIKNG